MKKYDLIKEVKKVTTSDRYIDLSGFEMQKTLNSKIWDGETLKPEIRKNLLKIADDYFESLEINNVDIEDVTFTGSLANYNWSEYSDVDLHILVDYKEIPVDEDLVQDFLKTKSTSWNQNHDVKIYGYDVELYVQDKKEPHVASGLFSLLNNEWIKKPTYDPPSVDEQDVNKKFESIAYEINQLHTRLISLPNLPQNAKELYKRGGKLKEKIMKMRKEGLSKEGEFAVGNLAFKKLRNEGYIEKLINLTAEAYDKIYTEK